MAVNGWLSALTGQIFTFVAVNGKRCLSFRNTGSS